MIKTKRMKDGNAKVTLKGVNDDIGAELTATIIAYSEKDSKRALAAMLSAMETIYGKEETKLLLTYLGQQND